MISHEYKCIFVHIPKTAGTSIEKKLGFFKELVPGAQDHTPIAEVEPLGWGHLFISSRRRLRLAYRNVRRRWRNAWHDLPRVTRQQYHSYFKFTFVRNPWSRVFSWYRNVMNDEGHQRALAIPGGCSLKEFLTTYGNQWVLNSQLDWIRDARGKIAVDFIGHFNRLTEDFARVARILGIKDPTLPKLVPGDRLRYTDFYDAETKDIVTRRFREEIEHFQFEFGE